MRCPRCARLDCRNVPPACQETCCDGFFGGGFDQRCERCRAADDCDKARESLPGRVASLEAEHEAHGAFYRLTVQQREAAWAEVEDAKKRRSAIADALREYNSAHLAVVGACEHGMHGRLLVGLVTDERAALDKLLLLVRGYATDEKRESA